MRTTLTAPVRSSRPGALMLAVTIAGALALTAAAPAAAASVSPDAPPAVDLGHETIAPGDGWASWSGPTFPERIERRAEPVTGGSSAAPADVYVVDTWQELRDALAGRPGGSQNDARHNTTPRIVYVTAVVDPWVRADGSHITCDDIAAQVTVGGSGAPFAMAD
ncbi:MAG: hypothetical protein WBX17_01360, partial [Microbacterium sp.]